MDTQFYIMIVEDESLVAKDIENMLKTAGYAISGVVHSGEDALRALDQTQPNLVLMDIGLKGDMDGIETAANIRGKYGIPVVFLTAYTDENTLERAKKTKPYGYIQKPFEMSELYTTLEMALNRYQTEESLRQNEELLDNILDSMSDGIVVLDTNFCFTYLNAAMEKISRISREELVNSRKKSWEIFPHLIEQGVDALMKQALQGEIVSKENIPYTLFDNHNGYTSETFLPLRTKSGDIRGALGIVRDITERKKTEGALQESKEWFRALFDSSRDANFILDSNLQIVDVNLEAIDFTGYSKEELLQKSIKDIFCVSSTVNWEGYFESVNNGNDEIKEMAVTHRNGKISTVEVCFRKIVIANTKYMYFTARDITFKKTAEKRLQKERDIITRIAEMSLISIAVVDKNGDITYANTRAEKTLGLHRDEITKRKYNEPEWKITDYNGEFFPDEQLPFKQILEKRKAIDNIKHAIEWPDGKRVLLSIDAKPLFDDEGEIDGMLALLHEVTPEEIK